jgi:hypothetical protein
MDLHERARRLTVREGPGPSLHLLASTASEAFDLAWALSVESHPRTVARVVRGAKCRSSHALFDEFAAAWQFPPYFGENWDALDECLADLEWLRAQAYVLIVADALQLLDEEPTDTFRLFVEIVADIARERSEDEGEPGRPPASFHVVFHAEPGDESALSERLTEVAAEFDLL